MAVTDPIADFLNRIKNAQKARFDKVDIPASRMKSSVAQILKDEGYIKNFKLVKDSKQGIIRVNLKYTDKREAAIAGTKRVSRPGRRVYVGYGDVPRVLNGLGIVIMSTSKGVMVGSEAQKLQVGGEVLCTVW
jgi:small subunit ribosomal protein S8